ncbi:MAG: Hsp20/alpha crystallin family protein [Desulfobacteraceae bacterium]|jgi:HSP20 family molecular chaperone IbpA
MTLKARHMRSRPQDRAISVDELFSAAFDNPNFYYQRESLLGWRPVTHDGEPHQVENAPRLSSGEKPSYSNSPDIIITDTPQALFIEVTLPEINEESLYLEVSGDLLIVRAERRVSDNDRSEWSQKSDKPMVHRYVKLPVAAQPGNVQARLVDHVLKVKINKPWSGSQRG